MKLFDALIATQKTRTHFDGQFLKKIDWTVEKVQKNLTLFTVFPDIFQNGTLNIENFFNIDLMASRHFI